MRQSEGQSGTPTLENIILNERNKLGGKSNQSNKSDLEKIIKQEREKLQQQKTQVTNPEQNHYDTGKNPASADQTANNDAKLHNSEMQQYADAQNAASFAPNFAQEHNLASPVQMAGGMYQNAQKLPAPAPKYSEELAQGNWIDRNIFSPLARLNEEDKNPLAKGAVGTFAHGVAETLAPAYDLNGNPGLKAKMQQWKPEGTGNQSVDDFLHGAGNFAGLFVDPSRSGVTGLYKTLTPASGAIANKVTNLVPNIGPKATKAIQAATQEGIAAGAYSVPFSLIQGQETPQEIGTNILYGGGAGLGLRALGKGVGLARNSIAKSADQVKPLEPIPTAKPSAQAAPFKPNWFTSLFGDQGVGISAFTSKGSKRPLTSEDVIVKRPIRDEVGGVKDAVTAEMRAQYQNHVDMFDPMKNAGNNVYDAAMDSSRANQLANNIVGKDFVTPEGVRIGDGMEALFKKVPRGLDKKFMDYLILHDAEARIPRGERVYHEDIKVPNPQNPRELIPLNSEVAVKGRREAMEKQFPWMTTLGKEWNQFTKNLREVYGVNEGILSQSQSDAMEAARPDYIKMMREFTRSEKPGRKLLGRSSATTFSGLKAPIKSVSPTGSARNIVDPRKTMAEYVGAMVNNAMKNRAGQKLFQNIKNDPEGMGSVARIVPETAEATKKSMDEINHILETDGFDGLLEKLNADFEMAFKKGGQQGGKDNVITVMVEGHPVRIEILNPEMALAFQGMNPTQAGIVTSVAQKLSNAIKRSATGPLAPLFAAKSMTVDLGTALFQSDNPIRFIPDYFHALISSVADKLNIPGLRNMARDFRLAGGGYSAALRGERALNKTVKNLDRLPLLSPKNIGRQALRWNPVSASFRLGETTADILENAPRMAAAKGKLRSLGGEKSQGNVRQAMNDSREITTNFSRKGRFSSEIEAWAPYSNAAVQGVYRVFKQFKTKPLKTIAAVTALSVMPKMIEYAQFHDDPDYQKLPARERFRNLIVSKNADGTFVKIPMEPAYNSIGEMTIETMRYFKDNDPEAFKGAMDALANAWTPPLVSGALQGVTQGGGIDQSISGVANATSFAPIEAIRSNQSFTGAPIEPMKVQDRSPQYRYDEKTSNLAKTIGEKLGYSPMKVDYIMRQYGGDAARILLPLNSDVGAGTPRNTLLRNFIVDPVFTNNLTNDYYQGKDLVSKAYRDNKEVGAPLPKWFTEDLRTYVTSTAIGSVSKQLTDLSDEKKTVQTSNLTAEDKAQKLREIQRKTNQIYIDVNTRMEQAGVPLMSR